MRGGGGGALCISLGESDGEKLEPVCVKVTISVCVT